MPIRVDLTTGHLTLDFDEIAFSLDTGQTVEFEVIEKVCDEYWTEWRERVEQAND